MTTFVHEVAIDRPAGEVFAFVNDPANTPLWQTSVIEAHQDTDGPMAAGARFTELRSFLGRRIETTLEVTEWDAGRRSSVRVIDGPIPGHGSYTVEPTDGGTKFTMRMEAEASGFFRLAEPIFARMARREFETNLSHLKDYLEAQD